MLDLPNPSVDPEEVRRITEAVLARPEFLEARPSWWRQGLRYVADWIARVLDLFGGGGRNSTIGTIVLVGILLLVAIVVWRFTSTVRRDPSRNLEVEGSFGRTADDWLTDARQFAAAGEWREALRCRYRALLSALAAEGLLEEVPGRTTGEYLAAVEADVPTAARDFTTVTRAFESAWYGHQHVGPDDVEQVAATARAVLTAAGIRQRQEATAP